MKRFFRDIPKYYSYARYSSRAELKAEVAGSYLNWIWWILEPVCLMLIYAFIFGVVFEAREKYFTAFIYIGLMSWTFFSQNLTSSVKMVKKNKAVVSKVYLPKFILIESKMFVNLFKMVVSFGIIVVLMIIYKVPLTINLIYVIPILICMWIVTFGFMSILMHFGVYVEDLQNVVKIGLKLVFYMTGIMYSIEKRVGDRFPEIAAIIGYGNPMAFLISSLRQAMLYGERPNLLILAGWSVGGILLSMIGITMIYKNENSYVKVI